MSPGWESFESLLRKNESEIVEIVVALEPLSQKRASCVLELRHRSHFIAGHDHSLRVRGEASHISDSSRMLDRYPV